MLSTIQTILMPLSFGFLLLLMLLYWAQVAFFSYAKYKRATFFVFFVSFLSLTALLTIRWEESGHFPLSNLYESLLFLSWSFLLSQLILQFTNGVSLRGPAEAYSSSAQKTFPTLSIFNTNSINAKKNESSLFNQKEITLYQQHHEEFMDLVGVILSPLALISYAFAFLNLPKEMQKATALVPALQSNWLMMHVTVMVLSYAALLCGSIFSMAFLIVDTLRLRQKNETQIKQNLAFTSKIGSVSSTPKDSEDKHLISSFEDRVKPAGFGQNQSQQSLRYLSSNYTDNQTVDQLQIKIQDNTQKNLWLCNRLDNLSYRVLGFGFPLLTVGILSGAVWANSAWGSYWSWDPKETWALITWLVFAIYLHARITKGWCGRQPAIVATVGFFAVWFCYLGVNLLGTGLHTYGSFSLR